VFREANLRVDILAHNDHYLNGFDYILVDLIFYIDKF